MKISDILDNLHNDAENLNPSGSHNVKYFLSRLASESEIKDPDKRQIRLFQTSMLFYKYAQTHDWLSEISVLTIDVDMAGLYYFPAQLLHQLSGNDLTSNCFFLAGLKSLLTVMLNDNALERAFASDSIRRWLQKFEIDLGEFFEIVTPISAEIPSHYPEIPKGMLSIQFCKLFELELIRIQSKFAGEFPQYNMFDAGELERTIQSEFNGVDPGPELTGAVAGRILRTVNYLLYTPDDDTEESDEYEEDQE